MIVYGYEYTILGITPEEPHIAQLEQKVAEIKRLEVEEGDYIEGTFGVDGGKVIKELPLEKVLTRGEKDYWRNIKRLSRKRYYGQMLYRYGTDSFPKARRIFFDRVMSKPRIVRAKGMDREGSLRTEIVIKR